MKSCTDIEQSKKLTEILPLESADMYWWHNGQRYYVETKEHNDFQKSDIPCWSLAALLDVLPDSTDIVKNKADTENEKYMCTVGVKHDIISTFGNNPVDACYEMITNLHKLSSL